MILLNWQNETDTPYTITCYSPFLVHSSLTTTCVLLLLFHYVLFSLFADLVCTSAVSQTSICWWLVYHHGRLMWWLIYCITEVTACGCWAQIHWSLAHDQLVFAAWRYCQPCRNYKQILQMMASSALPHYAFPAGTVDSQTITLFLRVLTYIRSPRHLSLIWKKSSLTKGVMDYSSAS